MDRLAELAANTPLNETIAAAYDRTRERVRHRDFKIDQEMASLWNARHSVAETSAAPAADRASLNSSKAKAKRIAKKIGGR